MKTRFLVAAMFAVAATLPLAASAGEGATVVRDAETGQLRAPTAAENAALRGKPAAAALRSAAPAAEPLQRKMASGAVMAEVPESLMQFTVVTRQADGTLTRACVQGAEVAAQMATKPQFAKPLSMSTARTARGMAYEVR